MSCCAYAAEAGTEAEAACHRRCAAAGVEQNLLLRLASSAVDGAEIREAAVIDGHSAVADAKT